MNSHLTPRQMLAYIDGELSRAETRSVHKHLHSCWTCLAEMERLKGDIATILDAEKEVFAPALPPPPHPWPGFQTILDRKLPAHPVSWWIRCNAFLHTFFSPARILVASGISAVLLIGFYFVFHTPTVSAGEVLRRVQAADALRSTITKDQVIRERVHIRKILHGQSAARQAKVDTWKSPSAAYWNVEDRDSAGDSAAADLKAQYQTHKIPVDLPLSSASVDSWGKAAGGSPTVSQQGADMDLTFAGAKEDTEGDVERVSLLIQPQDWHVKQMTLDFSDVSFEVTEEDYSVMPTSEVPADVLAYLEPSALPAPLAKPEGRPVSDVAGNAVHLPMVNLDTAELEVFVALHNLKADLGEPVTVTRSRQAVMVGLWQLPAGRQTELSAALSGKAGVQVELTAPHVRTRNIQPEKMTVATVESAPAAEGDTPLRVAGDSGDDDQKLKKYFGSSQREQDFTNEALDTSTAILSHLYALRNLQAEFPAEKSQLLAPEQRSQLGSLVQDHVRVISGRLEALSKQFEPLDAYFNVSSCTGAAASAETSWQKESLNALQTARGADHLLRSLLTTSQTPVLPDAALPQIRQRMCQLRAALGNLSREDIH